MTPREVHLGYLRAAEGQFRLATAVRLAVTFEHQPLDLPLQWLHGKHTVRYSEIALSREESDFAAWNLQRSATFLMASAALEGIKATTANPKAHSDRRIVAAYQISRMVRNAFAHKLFNPIWHIDADCRDQQFEVPDVIRLDTTGLDSTPFDWRQYGGPLALLRLSNFVRKEVLSDDEQPDDVIPLPERLYIQQGDLIFMKVNDIPAGAVPADVERLPDGGIRLPGGHIIRSR